MLPKLCTVFSIALVLSGLAQASPIRRRDIGNDLDARDYVDNDISYLAAREAEVDYLAARGYYYEDTNSIFARGNSRDTCTEGAVPSGCPAGMECYLGSCINPNKRSVGVATGGKKRQQW